MIIFFILAHFLMYSLIINTLIFYECQASFLFLYQKYTICKIYLSFLFIFVLVFLFFIYFTFYYYNVKFRELTTIANRLSSRKSSIFTFFFIHTVCFFQLFVCFCSQKTFPWFLISRLLCHSIDFILNIC